MSNICSTDFLPELDGLKYQSLIKLCYMTHVAQLFRHMTHLNIMKQYLNSTYFSQCASHKDRQLNTLDKKTLSWEMR